MKRPSHPTMRLRAASWRYCLPAAILGLSTFAANAQTAISQCDKVLEGALNTYINSSQANSSVKAELLTRLYKMNAEEAWNKYQEDSASAKTQGQSGSLAVQAWPYGGDGAFSISYANDISHDKFVSEFNTAKSVHEQSSSSSSSSDTSLATYSAIYVRDQRSIEAWETCVKQSAPIGIYAYGSRDDAGNPSINVIWVAGDFAGSVPSVPVDVSVPQGASLEPELKVAAIGSGTRSRIINSPQTKSFQVVVNASLTSPTGARVGSWSTTATLPALRPTPVFKGPGRGAAPWLRHAWKYSGMTEPR